jgi:pimeloyl-ACP methyl ester carboxylesterase
MNSFKEKIYDGPYEVVEIQITNEEKIFRGLIYFPDEKKFRKPYPVIVYLQGFSQVFPFSHIIQEHEYLLKLGFAVILIYLRGYKFSEGTISIPGQVSDGLKIIEFLELMADKEVVDKSRICFVGHDFGAYTSLVVGSKTDKINYLALLNPILDIERHVNDEDFIKNLQYINKFLPGMIHGIEDLPKFLEKTRIEVKEFPIESVICELKVQKILVILGDEDKLTPLEEFNRIFRKCNVNFEDVIIENMDHEPEFEIEKKLIEQTLTKFFGELV